MNELQKVRTLEVVAAEIRTFTASMLNNVIEIGRRMCEAKEMLPHGQFGTWIKENTGYSASTANNFMRLFDEYGAAQGSLFGAEVSNVQTFGNLSYTKALALLQVPAEERENFVRALDEAGTPAAEMSTRELQQAIRERDEARQALTVAQEDAREAISDAEEEADRAREEADRLRRKLEEMENRPVETIPQVTDPEELEKIRAEEAEKYRPTLEALEKKLAEAEEKAAREAEKARKLKEKAEKAGDAAKASMQKDMDAADQAKREAEAARVAAETRAAALEKQLKTADPTTAEFKIYFSQVQEDFNRMLGVILKAEPAQGEKLRGAAKAVLEQIRKQLEGA